MQFSLRRKAVSFFFLFFFLFAAGAEAQSALRVTSISTSQLTDTSVLIRWRTNVPGNSIVLLYRNSALIDTITDEALVTRHAIRLTGLSPRTRYSYRVRSIAANGLTRTGTRRSFTTRRAPNVPATTTTTTTVTTTTKPPTTTVTTTSTSTSTTRPPTTTVTTTSSSTTTTKPPTTTSTTTSSSTTTTVAQPPGNEFQGNQNSLVPYRESLTISEVRSLLGKVGFGGTPELETLCLQSGLTACVDALLNYSVPAAVTNAANVLRTSGEWRYILRDRAFLTYHFLYGSPLHSVMTLFLHDHMAVNYWEQAGGDHNYSDPCFVEHTDLLRAQALGNFETYTHSLDTDCLMSFWLDNRSNQKGNIGVNYSREVLELDLLGTRPIDKPTVETYTTADVYELGRAFTGYQIIAPGERWAVQFNSSRFDSGLKTLFAGKAWAATSNFNHDGAMTHVLYNHPESARYIGGKFFSVLAHPYATTAMIDELANDLRNGAFSIKPVLRKIMRSSAMFSPRALNVCVSSPIEFLSSFIRRMRLGIPGDQATMLDIAESEAEAGQRLLEPPSIFGWRGCGVNRDGTHSWGQRWLSPGGLLARANGIVNLLNDAQSSSAFFTNHQLVTNASLTPQAVVAAVAEPLNLRLQPAETTILVNYLQNIGGTTRTWSSLTQAQKRMKVAGLMELCAKHPRRFLR